MAKAELQRELCPCLGRQAPSFAARKAHDVVAEFVMSSNASLLSLCDWLSDGNADVLLGDWRRDRNYLQLILQTKLAL